MKTQLSIIAALVTLGLSGQANASIHDDVHRILADGKAQGKLRYRYEYVDQKQVAEAAHASTLLTRLNYTTGTLNGFNAFLEVDNVTQLGSDNYNSTVNGRSDHPVVADPKGTEVNQAKLQFRHQNWRFIAGRQRINLDDQRFVGGVAWRQNEQTYDGYRLTYEPSDAVKLDYSLVHNVNRIFGEKSAKSDLPGKLQLANAAFQLNPKLAISAFAYLYDFDSAHVLSSQTLGLRVSGKLAERIGYRFSYAKQQDYGDNPNHFDSDYWLGEVQGKLSHLGWKLGYEVLGADEQVGFSTPLATAHKFQGFADKFLGTPSDGVKDLYVGINGAVAGVKLSATYHQFDSDDGERELGQELDLTAAYKVSKNCLILLKYAMYDAKQHATDSDKFWLMVNHKF